MRVDRPTHGAVWVTTRKAILPNEAILFRAGGMLHACVGMFHAPQHIMATRTWPMPHTPLPPVNLAVPGVRRFGSPSYRHESRRWTCSKGSIQPLTPSRQRFAKRLCRIRPMAGCSGTMTPTGQEPTNLPLDIHYRICHIVNHESRPYLAGFGA